MKSKRSVDECKIYFASIKKYTLPPGMLGEEDPDDDKDANASLQISILGSNSSIIILKEERVFFEDPLATAEGFLNIC